eukprot:543231-Pyramimonas_sp.AAC.1
MVFFPSASHPRLLLLLLPLLLVPHMLRGVLVPHMLRGVMVFSPAASHPRLTSHPPSSSQHCSAQLGLSPRRLCAP